jgi:hypothetical protein
MTTGMKGENAATIGKSITLSRLHHRLLWPMLRERVLLVAKNDGQMKIVSLQRVGERNHLSARCHVACLSWLPDWEDIMMGKRPVAVPFKH